MPDKPWNVEPYVTQERIRTIHYGIGAIGAEVVRLCLSRPEIEIVGAIDSHPAKAGLDLGEAANAGRTLGITVAYEAEPLLRDVYADVVVHSIGSSLTTVYPQLISIISSEKSVISSCEELSFPWVRQPEISRKLDRRARETGVRILGTGVNPGFVMDFLPLVLATASQQVRSIHVERVVDVGSRRMQLQRKVGVGLSVEGFQRGANEGNIGHVGLRESLLMLADSMAWRLDDVTETLEPLVARRRHKTEFFSVERGYVRGLRQSVRGLSAGREVVRLDLEMSLGVKDPRDVIRIDGTPPIEVRIPGGLQGDQATAAIVTNCIPAVVHSRAVGLLTMRDLPVVPYIRPRPQPREEFE